MIPWVKERRERRAREKAFAEEARQTSLENLRHYRTPVQVCPRGCKYHELARRDLDLRTKRGRAEITASFAFETRNCPKCGAPLVRECARCKEAIFAPVVDLCRICGLPQPWAAERRAGTDRASIRLWHPDDAESDENKKKGRQLESPANYANDPAIPLFYSLKKKKKKSNSGKKDSQEKRRGDLWVIEGDLVQLDVDALVSNDDVDGQMWAQVARAIKKAAGEGVERLAQEGKPFKLGQAWITTAGTLQHLKGIIHVASMDRRGVSNEETVREALAAALKLAAEKKYRSIALAPFGIATIGRNPWFEMFTETAVTFLSDPKNFKGKKEPLSIVLVLFEPHEFGAEAAGLQRLADKAWVRIGEPDGGHPQRTTG